MNDIIIQLKEMKLPFFILIFTYFALSFSPAFGYTGTTHKKIAVAAVNKSSLDGVVKQLGFAEGIEQIIQGNFEEKNIGDWITYGSTWEDWILSPIYYYHALERRGSYYCHFFNPITDLGYTDSNGNEKGLSLVERANDNEIDEWGFVENEWSYPMIKDLYHAALTGNSTKYSVWRMRDDPSMFSFSGKNNLGQGNYT